MTAYISGRGGPWVIQKELNISLPVGAQTVNVFKVSGTVRVIDQWARITNVTRLDNCTGVYSDFWDGDSAVPLTTDGIDLSNKGVGSFFTKDLLGTEPYSVIAGVDGGMLETRDDDRIGRPFTVTQKGTNDAYIRLHATAGGDTQIFRMFIYFAYQLLDGGSNFEVII